MESLVELVNCLDREEAGMIEHHFRLQSDRHKGKRLELFKLIREKRKITDGEAALLLYQSSPHSAYSHLKKRLHNNIIDLLFPGYVKVGRTPFDQARFQSLRHLTLGRFLSERGAWQEAERQLTEGVALCKEYGLEAELMLTQELLQGTVLPELEGCQPVRPQRLDFSEPLSREAAEHFYHHVRLALDQDGRISAELAMDLHSCAAQLEKPMPDRSQPSQTRVLILAQTMRGLEAAAASRFDDCLEIVAKARDLMGRSPKQFSAKAHAKLRHLEARSLIAKGRCPEAASLLKQWKKEVIKGTHEYQTVKELWYFLALATDRIEHARLAVDEMMDDPALDDGFVAMKWHFYDAAVSFLEGDHERSLLLLFHNKALLKYKKKWLYGYKWLELLNFIECRKFDLVEYRLNAFRQLLKRKDSSLVQREKYLCKIVGQLLKKNFNYQAMLNQENEMPSARALGYEVFATEAWLVAKQRITA